MKREALLNVIASTAYNVGYGAKKHFSTYDIVNKIPGWITLFSTASAVLALFVPEFESKWLGAAFLIISFGSISIAFYDKDKDSYATSGAQLTKIFHQLRVLYAEVTDRAPLSDVDDLSKVHEALQTEALAIGQSKQIFLSDWYAHYKFFWQGQSEWVSAELNHTFWRDKMPLGATFSLIVLLAALVIAACKYKQIFQHLC